MQHPNFKIRSELSRVIGCVFKKCAKQDMDFTSNGGFIIAGANNFNEKSVITLIKLNSKAEL